MIHYVVCRRQHVTRLKRCAHLKLVTTRTTMAQEEKVWNPPPKVENLFQSTSGNAFSGLNSPKSGHRTDQALVVGSAPVQLYSTLTPNSVKVCILLEELGVNYDANLISISKGDQFSSGFVEVNPNSKIPALVDKEGPGGKPITIFESASIMIYLAEKCNKFWFTDTRLKTEAMSWLFWQMSAQGPMTGNFGHFMVYAPDGKLEARDYGVARYGMEVQRLCSVLDNHLKDRQYMVNNEYSIVDMAIFPWFYQTRTGYVHKSGVSAKDFLSVDQYTNAIAWADRIAARPAVDRGRQVLKNGVAKPWLEGNKS